MTRGRAPASPAGEWHRHGHIHIELGLLALIPLMAVLMARGIGR